MGIYPMKDYKIYHCAVRVPKEKDEYTFTLCGKSIHNPSVLFDPPKYFEERALATQLYYPDENVISTCDECLEHPDLPLAVLADI